MSGDVVRAIAGASVDELLAGLGQSSRCRISDTRPLSDGTLKLVVKIPPREREQKTSRRGQSGYDIARRHGMPLGDARV